MASPAPDASQLKDGILFKDVTKRTLLALEQLLAESLKPTSTYENYILVPKAEYQKLVALSDKSVKNALEGKLPIHSDSLQADNKEKSYWFEQTRRYSEVPFCLQERLFDRRACKYRGGFGRRKNEICVCP